MASLSKDGPDSDIFAAPSGLLSGSEGRPTPSWRGRRAALLAAAAAAVLGCAALLGTWGRPRGIRIDVHAQADEIIDDAATNDPLETTGTVHKICNNFPRLAFVQCLHNNLALKGPDQGDEGMVFEAQNKWTGKKFQVVVNAVSSYSPFSSRMNGMSGEYGTLNLVSGSSVKVTFSVRDPVTKQPIVEPYFGLTFFDLDQGLSGTSQESVTVSHFTSFALSDDVHPGAGTEVRLIRNADGSRTFKSSTFGTGADNPKDPLDLTKQQKNRAVSLRFRNFRSVDVTFAASAGLEPRFFTFVTYPALLCDATYQNNFLTDLKHGGGDTPIIAHKDDIFKQWFVRPGDQVGPGSELCAVQRADGSMHVYRAPGKGSVKSTQAGLKEGDLISQRLHDKTVAVIGHDSFPPLPTNAGDGKTKASAGSKFKAWHVKKNDLVAKGDPICDIVDAQGQVTTLTASKAGPVSAIMDSLKPGMSTDLVKDGNLAVIGRLPKLPVAADSTGVNAPSGSTFVRYLVNVGDTVASGTPVAEVQTGGSVQEVQTPSDGTVTARQENLLKGMAIDEAMVDKDLVVVATKPTGKQSKLPPLKVNPGEHPAAVPPGMTFVAWHKNVGDIVNNGDPLLDVRNANGDLQTLAATGEGVVMRRQDALKKGDRIDDRMMDRNLLVVGKLEPLKVDVGEVPSNVPPGSFTFKEYKVAPGDVVQPGDVVATVTDSEGRVVPIKATKYGKVTARQENLKEGASISGVMKDRNLLTVGKYPSMAPSGLRQQGVTAPQNAVFNQWYVKDGQKVQAGDKVAQVTLPNGSGGRRLAPGFGGGGGKKLDIHAPIWGTISGQQPLKSGETIGAQQTGPNIAVIDQGPPWWLGILAVLSVLCCCLCILFGVMKKPVPYVPMPTQEPVPEPVREEPEPDGLRLDFEDGQTVHRVYAKYRPLGIKHNFKAPIIANDFTINSYAKLMLGVKEGWKLRRIGREELHDCPSFEEVNGKLTEYMRDFELWSLPIDFKRTHTASEKVTVEFRQRPIGIEFTNRAPIKVSKVHPGSPAQAEGVTEGWVVTRIGEADVTQNTNFREVIGYFNEGVQPLDEAGGPSPQGQAS